MFVNRSKQRSGFTIIEVMAVTGVIGILLALLLPAVQQVRSRARNLECKNHLRQIGTALANAESTNREFPSMVNCLKELLPYLGEGPAYSVAKQFPPVEIPRIPLFQCPSETIVHPSSAPQTPNYRINTGTVFPQLNRTGFNGFRISRVVNNSRARDFEDGLSQTAAFSERLVPINPIGRGAQIDIDVLRRETGRYPWSTEILYTARGEEAAAVDQCRNHRLNPIGVAGVITPSVLNMHVGYDHLLPPNHVACLNGPNLHDWGIFASHLIPPSSLHVGGVNVLFADGSVHFIANEIDLETWNALGSRNGSETVSF